MSEAASEQDICVFLQKVYVVHVHVHESRIWLLLLNSRSQKNISCMLWMNVPLSCWSDSFMSACACV